MTNGLKERCHGTALDTVGNSFPSVPKLATKCRMSARNANYILARLQDSGELDVNRNAGGPRGQNRYHIVFEALGAVKCVAPLKGTSPLKPASGQGCNTLQGRGEAGCRSPLKPAADKPPITTTEPSGNLFFAEQHEAASAGKASKKSKKVKPGKQDSAGKTVPTWQAYAAAFHGRYGTDPIRNRTVNAQLAQLVDQLGAEEAPQVAAYYLTCNEPLYVGAVHPVGLLLRDVGKLRTLWKMGRTGAAAPSERERRMQEATGPLMRLYANRQEELEQRNLQVAGRWAREADALDAAAADEPQQ